MTTHELANYLLEKTKNVPVEINGWGSDEGTCYEVSGATYSKNENSVFLGYNNKDNKWDLIGDKI